MSFLDRFQDIVISFSLFNPYSIIPGSVRSWFFFIIILQQFYWNLISFTFTHIFKYLAPDAVKPPKRGRIKTIDHENIFTIFVTILEMNNEYMIARVCGPLIQYF